MSTNTSNYHKENLKALDGLRGIAAIYVLVGHARMLLMQPYYEGYLKHPEAYGFIDKVMVYFFSIFKYGHEAVIVFFVLSGFVIHLQQAKGFKNKENAKPFKLSDYFLKRTLRIYPTLVAALILTFLLDYISNLAFNDPKSLTEFYNLKTFASNVILLPNHVAWGTDVPMWSLKHEWFFYMIYPILLWLSLKNFTLPLMASIILFVLFFVGFRVPFVEEASYTLLIWWMGALTAEIYCNRFVLKFDYKFYLIFGVLMLFLFFIPIKDNNGMIHDLFVGVLSVIVISIILSTNLSIIRYPFLLCAPTGAFSFSIYMMHFPLLYFFRKVVLLYSPNHQVPYHAWFVVGAIAVTIPFIYLVYLLSEKPAQRFKTVLFAK